MALPSIPPTRSAADALKLPTPLREDWKALAAELPGFPVLSQADPLAGARAYLAQGREAVAALHRQGISGRSIVRLTSELTDRLLKGLFQTLWAAPEGVALAAVGGYGRKELAPCSDIDVLLLHDGAEPGPEVASFAERLHTLLWDLKLEVGWRAQNPAQCAELARTDHTARTALVDCRPVCGDPALYARFERAVLDDLLTARADAFIADKAEEMRRRRQRFGDTVFLLEPDIKQGDGGLRDLQGALWIARARFRAAGLKDLLQRSVLPPGEVQQLREARDLVWRIRNEMHYAAGRKEDRLTFDMQEKVALAFGYVDREGDGELAVEALMRHYYLAASLIKRSADALVDRCEENRRRGPPKERGIDSEFKAFNGRLTLQDGQLFNRDPSAVVRLFAVADREGLPLHSFARDKLLREPEAWKGRLAEDPKAVATFKQMLIRRGTRGLFLRQMHELGVLSAVVPAFGRVTAMHRHDAYHVYTVDVHSLLAMERLIALRNGALAAELPELTRLASGLERPLVLLFGMLFHDVGKGHGVPGKHSEEGALLVDEGAKRLGLDTREAEDVAFLVREHLTMSYLSQHRDLSDPSLVADFARKVGTRERLDMLYLLTHADIASVGPGTWTDWKAGLLRELHEKTAAKLAGEVETSAPRTALAQKLSARFSPAEIEGFVSVLPDRYFQSVGAPAAARHLRLLARGAREPLAASLVHHRRRGLTELALTASDRPGLLALLTGVLAAHRIDILRAEIFSTSDGRVIDLFDVQAPRGTLVERERWHAARSDLARALAGEIDVPSLLAHRASAGILDRRVPRVEVQVAADNRASRRYTVVDIYAKDRVGLLHAIAQALFQEGVEIALAKVATESHRAADSFYVHAGGKKIEDPQKLQAIETALRRALEAE